MRRISGLVLLAAVLGTLTPAQGGPLDQIETEFERAIRNVSPATVICVPADFKPGRGVAGGMSSGVLIDRKGWILSDGDVGVWHTQEKRGAPVKRHETSSVEVRLPDLKGRGFREYMARVIVRNRTLDTSLLKLEKPPTGLKVLDMANSDDLRVGQFAFAMGNSFGMAAEAPPTLTAGMIASLVPSTKGGEGKWAHIYTSAAVNPGVNGGPLVDARGRLVATISGPVAPWDAKGDANQPYQFLGKAIPIRRLAAWYANVPEAKGLFDSARRSAPSAPRAAALEMVVQQASQSAYRVLVSIEVERKKPYKEIVVAGQRGLSKLPRYSGPVSGYIVSEDGYVLTSLYNLTNVFTIANGVRLPPKAPAALRANHLLDRIQGFKVWLPDGSFSWARLSARHEGLGLALLELVEEKPAPPAPPAKPEDGEKKDGESKDTEEKDGEESDGEKSGSESPEEEDLKDEDVPAEPDIKDEDELKDEDVPAEPELKDRDVEDTEEKDTEEKDTEVKDDTPTPAPSAKRTYAVKPLPTVPQDAFQAGRFVVAAAHPFGKARLPDPLVAFGVLSKQHAVDSTDRWAGAWQTDASLTDATCGGVAVDLEGRLIGMLQLWSPSRHGRNSGIGFIVPWTLIEEVLPDLMRGRDFRAPFLGVEWGQNTSKPLKIGKVLPRSAAAGAGLKVGDVIVAIDGVPVETIADAAAILSKRWSGDRLELTVERGSETLELIAVLGARE